MKFGIFDHIDDAGIPLGELYANRLTIAEALERAGFYGYHVAEHHITPLGAAASPGLIFSALASKDFDILEQGPLIAGTLTDAYGLGTALAIMPLFCIASAVVLVMGARSYSSDADRVDAAAAAIVAH